MTESALKSPRAFTLIEVMIVIMIIAILTVALVLGYSQLQLKVRYDTHVTNIERIFQEVRSRSLSTVLIEDTEPTEYYKVEFTREEITLSAHGETLDETIEVFEFDGDIEADTEFEVYYFPPNGEICLGNHNCTSTATQVSTTLEDSGGTYSTSFTVSAAGGYLEVE